MVQNQPVSFGEKRGFSVGSALKAVKDGVINVGTTVVAGGVVGGAAGKLAALKPYTPSVADYELQFADIFEKASRSENLPKHIENAGDELKNLVNAGKKIAKDITPKRIELKEAGLLYDMVDVAADDAIKDRDFQKKIMDFLKDTKDKVPQGGYTKENVSSRLKEKFDEASRAVVDYTKKFCDTQEDFVKKALETKDKSLTDIAQKGAKHLRKRSIIGAGIAVGVLGALALNLLNTYGVIGRKKAPAQTQNQ